MPRRVVVALDPSPVSLDALRWATHSLCGKDDELHLISVLESGLKTANVAGESAEDSNPDCKPDPVALAQRQDLLRRCKGEAEGVGLRNIKLVTLVSCVGGSTDMARHIVEYADGQHADLVVVGSRGMGGVRRALLGMVGLGSVSDFVTKNSQTNVVVHKMAAPS